MANNISATSVSHRSSLSGNFLESLFLDSVSEQEVIEICKSLKSGTAVGYDNVMIIIIPLTHIINMSIVSGILPDELTIACVIPLFRSEDRSLFTNYRPVSVLPAFSKIFERAIYNRLLSYLDKHKVLSNSQFGFRKNHATEYTLTLFYEKISSAIDNKEISVGIFIDLSKALLLLTMKFY